MTLLEVLQFPVKAVIVLLVLPFVLMEHVIFGLNMLASIGSLLRCDDKKTAIKFLTAYNTGTLLKVKFPNSIAVRS